MRSAVILAAADSKSMILSLFSSTLETTSASIMVPHNVGAETTGSSWRASETLGAIFLKDRVHRRIQRIHLMVHYLIGFASTSANRPDRSVGVDALGCKVEICRLVFPVGGCSQAIHWWFPSQTYRFCKHACADCVEPIVPTMPFCSPIPHFIDEWSAPHISICLLYTSPSPRDKRQSRMPSSA